MLQVRTTASLANTPEEYARVSSQALKSGVELARNSVQRQEGFAQEEKVERYWMALQRQLLHDLERGVQWTASALRQRNPDGRLCLQFRNLFAKRCNLVLYSSGSGILLSKERPAVDA